MNPFKRFLTPPLIVIAALLMWIEETLWLWTKRMTAVLERLAIVQSLEAAISRLSPMATVCVFFLPMLALFPLKIIAVYLVSRGYWLASVGLYLFAKIFGTAIVARLFVVCHPKLMTIAWFRRCFEWLRATRDWLYATVRQMPAYQVIKRSLQAIKHAARRFAHRFKPRRGLWKRWRAIRRWQRQRNGR